MYTHKVIYSFPPYKTYHVPPDQHSRNMLYGVEFKNQINKNLLCFTALHQSGTKVNLIHAPISFFPPILSNPILPSH